MTVSWSYLHDVRLIVYGDPITTNGRIALESIPRWSFRRQRRPGQGYHRHLPPQPLRPPLLSYPVPPLWNWPVSYFLFIYSGITHSRNPSIYNNYFDSVHLGIDSRDSAQLLVENNVFFNTSSPLYSTNGGYAFSRGNDFGGAKDNANVGSLTSVPYSYSLSSTSSVKSDVLSGAGAVQLSF